MRIASLGSGSKGNATLVDTGETLVLIDCGLPRREAEARLAGLGVAAPNIDAILVTHEHGDHCRGVVSLARAHEIPVFLTAGTASSQKLSGLLRGIMIRPGDQFDIGDLTVLAEPVPHDAREPIQFCLHHAGLKLGVLTDLGSITPHVVGAFSGCDALILEFNHDPQMLDDGPYPYSVKKRVGGDFGHLTNAQARQFLDYADTSKLRLLFVAHISQQNNHPELADAVLSDWEDRARCQVIHATQDKGFDWVDLRKMDMSLEAAAQA